MSAGRGFHKFHICVLVCGHRYSPPSRSDVGRPALTKTDELLPGHGGAATACPQGRRSLPASPPRCRSTAGMCAHRSRGDAQEGEIGYRGPYRWSVTALYDMAAAWPEAAVWPG